MIPDPNQPGVGGHHPTAQEVILGALRDGTVDSREHTLALSERAETAEAERDRLREALHEVGERTDYIAGEMDDCERGDLERDLLAIDVIVNRALTADLGPTSGGFHTEEPKP